MEEQIVLKGMTWDHSRGVDPMLATSAEFSQKYPNVKIEWDKRSLQAFADRPIGEMAAEYDLMVIDHPHVGEVAKHGHLIAFDGQGRDDELSLLEQQSVGASHQSYQIGGHQWGLAIDTATPVATYRPDRLSQAPTCWKEVLELAKGGEVALALIPINAMMTFFGMAKNQDFKVAEGQLFIEPENGREILLQLKELVSHLDPRCLELDPIGIFDWMSTEEDAPAYSPFGYGYTNYSRQGYRPHLLQFTDAPGIRSSDPKGTVIGGTGIAISAKTAHQDLALEYAFWIASAECQKGIFFESGGQPANAVAWEDEACNRASMDFFTRTRATLESSWVRPRYNGYMDLQEQGGDIIHAYLRNKFSLEQALQQLQSAYVSSQL